MSAVDAKERLRKLCAHGVVTCQACALQNAGSHKRHVHDDGNSCFRHLELKKGALDECLIRPSKRQRVAISESVDVYEAALRLVRSFDEKTRARFLSEAAADSSSSSRELCGDSVGSPCPPLSLLENPLLGSDFSSSADMRESAILTHNFTPRSALVNEPGKLSALVGERRWFFRTSFWERLQTLVRFFERRDLFLVLPRDGQERKLLTAELALYKRVNPSSRLAAPATTYAYRHYFACIAMRIPAIGRSAALREFILNASLVRNTLSHSVRAALQTSSFPWLELTGSSVTNARSLHDFFLLCGGKIFGDYVNPMRKRSEESWQGYAALWADLNNFISSLDDLERAARHLHREGGVAEFLRALRRVPGYGGSGFRAKEVFCDSLDNIDLFLPLEVLSAVRQQYAAIDVIGVGPCRVVNYFFNKPFFFNEHLDNKKKEAIYVPLLQWVAQILRTTWPRRYSHRTNLDIYYELCEYNKALIAWYYDANKDYRPAGSTAAASSSSLATSVETLETFLASALQLRSDCLRQTHHSDDVDPTAEVAAPENSCSERP